MTEIITDEKLLGTRADEIDTRKQGKQLQQIIIDLKAIVREKSLKYLTAPQIGENFRVIVLNFNGDIKSFVNPLIVSTKGFQLSKETCNSIPDKVFIRPRNNNIVVSYQTPLGKVETRQFVGMAAVIMQHAVDHLDGLLLSDIGLEIDEDYENANDEDKQKIIEMYMDSLDIRRKAVKEEIETDKELNKISKAIDFVEQAQTGKIETEFVALNNNEVDNERNELTTEPDSAD